ncbi:MAG: CotH kinase family protein [Acidobacteria bacterium]|nr:CotH kinase family protein [Acidobacteriota bacterium]
MRHVAVEAYLAEEDGIVGDFGLNNFYLYRFEGTKRFQFIPWDKSQVFSSINRRLFNNLETNVLTRRAIAIPELQNVYVDTLLESATSAGGPGGWLEQEVARLYALIAEAVRSDTKKLCYGPGFAFISCPNEQFEAGVAFLTQFARERNAVLMREIFPAEQPAQSGTILLPPKDALQVFSRRQEAADGK